MITLPPLVTKAGAFDEDGVFTVAKIRATARDALVPITGDKRFATVRDVHIQTTYGHPKASVVAFIAHPVMRNVRRVGFDMPLEGYPDTMPWTDMTLSYSSAAADLPLAAKLAPGLRTLRFEGLHNVGGVTASKAFAKITALHVTGHAEPGPVMAAVARSKHAKALETVEIEYLWWIFRFAKRDGTWNLHLSFSKRTIEERSVARAGELVAGVPKNTIGAYEIVLPKSGEKFRAEIEAIVSSRAGRAKRPAAAPRRSAPSSSRSRRRRS